MGSPANTVRSVFQYLCLLVLLCVSGHILSNRTNKGEPAVRKSMLVCAGLAVAMGVVSLALWRELRIERSRAAHAPGQELPVVEPPASPAAIAQAPPPAPAPVTSPVTPEIQQRRAEAVALISDPEYANARLQRLRQTVPQDYPGLVEEMGLTPEMASKLFDLLARVQLEKLNANGVNPIDVQAGMSTDNVSAIQQVMRTRQDIERRRQESLAALLGNEGHERFKEYEAARPARSRVDALGKTLASMGHPLNAAQTRPLVAAYIAEGNRRREFSQQLVAPLQSGTQPLDQNRADQAYLEFQMQSNRLILEAVQPVMNAGQLEALRSVLDQPLAEGRAAQRVRQEQSRSQGN
jgi:hypothetical protein